MKRRIALASEWSPPPIAHRREAAVELEAPHLHGVRRGTRTGSFHLNVHVPRTRAVS
jgi:hypothetical protein